VFRAPEQGGELPRLYGGLIVAQALGAASRTVAPERRAHSLHCYFLRMGSHGLPVDYTVERTRDGRSYSSRRVVARQDDSVIFAMAASFHADEPGLEHQVAMPVTPGPEGLPPMGDVLRFPGPGSTTFDLIEVRMQPSFAKRDPKADPEEHRQLWFRSAAPLGDSPSEQECLLGFASDLMPSLIVLSRHGIPPTKRTETASLDHAVWFHRPFRADRWLCYDQVSPVAFGGRGLFTGRIFTEEGLLVASVLQEVQLRVRDRA
jgi:acyl-CoA thioesterase-2